MLSCRVWYNSSLQPLIAYNKRVKKRDFFAIYIGYLYGLNFCRNLNAFSGTSLLAQFASVPLDHVACGFKQNAIIKLIQYKLA